MYSEKFIAARGVCLRDQIRSALVRADPLMRSSLIPRNCGSSAARVPEETSLSRTVHARFESFQLVPNFLGRLREPSAFFFRHLQRLSAVHPVVSLASSLYIIQLYLNVGEANVPDRSDDSINATKPIG